MIGGRDQAGPALSRDSQGDGHRAFHEPPRPHQRRYRAHRSARSWRPGIPARSGGGRGQAPAHRRHVRHADRGEILRAEQRARDTGRCRRKPRTSTTPSAVSQTGSNSVDPAGKPSCASQAPIAASTACSCGTVSHIGRAITSGGRPCSGRSASPPASSWLIRMAATSPRALHPFT